MNIIELIIYTYNIVKHMYHFAKLLIQSKCYGVYFMKIINHAI